MKIFKFLAMLTISVLLFTGCEKEEITNYAFQEISAPTNVMANFAVAQDDSGNVTITPSGEGAQVFQVYFGDGDSTPVEVAQGESVSYTYDEGEYLVRVVAVGSTGLTSEFNQRLLISFKAPENLEVNVTQSASNPAMVSVSASADFAATFDVYFGEVEDEEPVQLMPDGSIDYTYASPGTYTIRVVAKGAGAATTETTVDVVVPEANDPVKLPITYDLPTVNYALGTFNGATFSVVTNPFLSGANTEENMVGKLVNSGALYEGGAYELGEPVDFSGANKTITMKFYSDKPIDVLLKFEGGATNADRALEVSAAHGGTGWEVLTFNFATDAVKSFIDGDPENGAAYSPNGKYSTLVLFAEIGKTTAGTFYIDNIMKAGANGGGETAVATKLPINFENNETLSGVFEGNAVTGMPVANPDKSGINTSETVFAFTKGNGAIWYSGIFQIFPQNIDLTAGKTFSFKIWSPKAGINVRMQLEKEGDGGAATVFRDVTLTEANKWVTLTYNFDNLDVSAGIDKFVIFPNFDDVNQPAGDGSVYYIDDIAQSAGGGNTGGPVASTKTSFPVNLETPANGGAASNWSVFENADNLPLEIIANPDPSGANTSATVAKFTARQAGQPFAGTITQLQTPFTLSASNSTVKILVWKTVISDVGIKFENAAGGSTGEVKVANTKINQWEELTFDFSSVIGDPNNINITGLVVFPDFKGGRAQDNVVYFDNIRLTAGGGTTGGGTSGGDFGLPVTFDGNATFTTSSASIPFKVVTNPKQSGINPTATKVGEVTNAGGQYEALSFILDKAIDFSGSNKTITMKVYSEVAYPVLFKLETGVNGERSNQVQVNHTGSGWEELTFNFATDAKTSYVSDADPGGAAFVPTGKYDEISIFLDFAGTTAGTFYIDDIKQN